MGREKAKKRKKGGTKVPPGFRTPQNKGRKQRSGSHKKSRSRHGMSKTPIKPKQTQKPARKTNTETGGRYGRRGSRKKRGASGTLTKKKFTEKSRLVTANLRGGDKKKNNHRPGPLGEERKKSQHWGKTTT